MGRPRSSNQHLPPRIRVKGGRFYYDTQAKPRRYIPLGADYAQALVKWAELEGRGFTASTAPTLGMAAERYRREVMPTKAPRTQADNEVELVNLLAVFRDAPLASIKPAHVRGYLDVRGKVAKTRANREKALLSHIFNKAREWGYTDSPNPCAGVKGFTETGRDRYVEGAEYLAVYAEACVPLRNAMDLAYLAGQRPADTMKATAADVRDGALHVTQGKTGKRLRIALSGDFGRLVESLMPRQTRGRVVSLHLIRDEDEQHITYGAMSQRFRKARQTAQEAARAVGNLSLASALDSFQFRDLRAKSASDAADLAHAQKLLGHATRGMTEHYVRDRQGDLVQPVTARVKPGRR